jgi:O-methyltransferase involved in polyketide biosynthesis
VDVLKPLAACSSHRSRQSERIPKEANPMSKLDVDSLTGVSETLLIPLHYRVEESKAESSTFKDEMGERFYDAIAYDWQKFQGQAFKRPAFAARTTILDRQVKTFVENTPDALVVNLGAGLDTRFYRLDNGHVVWIEIDLPDVIAFRRKLDEPTNPRHIFLSGSVLDPHWLTVVKRHERPRILFVAEGLFPYFTQQQHEFIFGYLVDNFPGQEMLFQTLAPSMIHEFVQYSDLTNLRTNVDMQWGFEESRQVSSLNPKVRFVSEFSLLEGNERLLPEEVQKKLPPEQLRKLAKIVHVQFG